LRTRRRNHRDLGVILAIATALVSAPSQAQDRDPAQRQTLLDLAFVLGEAHALKLLCEPEDQYWRARMQRLIDLEKADLAFTGRLTDRFNVGFSVGEGQFRACSPQSRAEASRVARRGRDLALALGRAS
jgi:uncharacterized protein (TIGR02301 family)